MNNLSSNKEIEKTLDSILNVTKLEQDFINDTTFSTQYESLMTANLDTPTLVGKYSAKLAIITARISELEIQIKSLEARIREDYRKEISNHRVSDKTEIENRILLNTEYIDLLNMVSRNKAKAKMIENYTAYILKNRNYNIGYHIELMKFKDKTYWNF